MPPSQPDFYSGDEARRLYERGLEGAYSDPASEAELLSTITKMGGQAHAFAACSEYNLFGSGAGKVSLPYLAALEMYPGCLPGGAQQTGDCVSWSSRSAMLVSYCAALRYGDNAERFVHPQVSDAARTAGVFSTESLYWFRQHGGQGWNCGAAAKVMLEKSGMLVRKNYPEIDLNLETYSGRMAQRWGASSPPAEVIAVTSKNLLRNATVCRTYEEVRDLIAAGFAISTCGSEAFQGTRNQYGICNRSMSIWRHAMSLIACDDREETVRREGCGLVCVQNSWGPKAVDGPDVVYGTPFKIPPGSFWARWNDVAGRYMVAVGSGIGWPAAKFPDWGLTSVI